MPFVNVILVCKKWRVSVLSSTNVCMHDLMNDPIYPQSIAVQVQMRYINITKLESLIRLKSLLEAGSLSSGLHTHCLQLGYPNWTLLPQSWSHTYPILMRMGNLVSLVLGPPWDGSQSGARGPDNSMRLENCFLDLSQSTMVSSLRFFDVNIRDSSPTVLSFITLLKNLEVLRISISSNSSESTPGSYEIPLPIPTLNLPKVMTCTLIWAGDDNHSYLGFSAAKYFSESLFHRSCTLYLKPPFDCDLVVFNKMLHRNAVDRVRIRLGRATSLDPNTSCIFQHVNVVEFTGEILPPVQLFKASKLPQHIWLFVEPSYIRSALGLEEVARAIASSQCTTALKLHLRIPPKRWWYWGYWERDFYQFFENIRGIIGKPAVEVIPEPMLEQETEHEVETNMHYTN
jgi:hypothetical protein